MNIERCIFRNQIAAYEYLISIPGTLFQYR